MASPPDKLTGAEFEHLIVQQAEREHRAGVSHIRRSGVQAVRSDGGWIVIPSRPDFEGPVMGVGHVEFDAKVCSQASMGLDPYRDLPGKRGRRRQIQHLYDRASFGVCTALLIHWNRRKLRTRTEEAETWLVQVRADLPLWRAMEDGELRSLRREHCREYGAEVEWRELRTGKLLPRLAEAFDRLAAGCVLR